MVQDNEGLNLGRAVGVRRERRTDERGFGKRIKILGFIWIAGRRKLENPMRFKPTFMKQWRLV